MARLREPDQSAQDPTQFDDNEDPADFQDANSEQ